jgi:GDP-L-fucose synthase
MYRDSKIYIAGHTGLLGTALLIKLKNYGYENIITKTRNELDLTKQNDVANFFKKEKPEYVFMAAGATGGIIANKTYPAKFLHDNISMQDCVFEAANRYEVKHIVFYGSSCIYPKDAPQPMKEEHLMTGSIEETSEAYAIAKTVGIIACRSYNKQYQTNRFIALVPNSMYGPNDNFDLENSHVLAALIRKLYEAKVQRKENIVLWGSGTPQREFIFSEDVADASIFAMKNADILENTHYNVGTGIDYPINKLSETIAKILGFKGAIAWDMTKPDGTMRKLLDSSKFLSLGWKPSISFKEGLEITCQSYLDNLMWKKG